ncbi:MAG: hypothetical protein IJJ25_12185 [Lachnospiraceae bacterium]|nr:hypothetical protein [Lachnospiraceae bacterium]
MIMTEAQKFEAAITCISRLAEGRNPGTGEQMDDPILEDLKVVRCLYFAEKVLTKALRDLPMNNAASQQRETSIRSELPGQDLFGSDKDRGILFHSDWEDPENETAEGEQKPGWLDTDEDSGTAEKRKETAAKKKKIPFPFEILSLFIYREDKSITHLLRQFSEPAGDLNIKLPNAAAIHKWFGANGYLVKEAIEPGGKEFWMPTEKGKELGMYTREGYFKGNRIVSVMFDEKAQYFLAENLEKIVNSGENSMP